MTRVSDSPLTGLTPRNSETKAMAMDDNAPTSRPAPPLPDMPTAPEQITPWFDALLDWADGAGATDLHFFPEETTGRLWARMDGDLAEIAHYPIALHQRAVARLKALSRCADYDGQAILEGRFAFQAADRQAEARLSVARALRGEKAVVRLLSGAARRRRLDELGFPPELTDALREALLRPQGMLLTIGPSGCGKSTTLYALLEDLTARAGRPLSILTIEDPVEQSLPCAAQINIDPARGLGFAEALRALLRQDPEVIMIGEIRDAETAHTALHAALTGHRLLSSMHTLTAAEALIRLRQMGAAPYVIASSLAGLLNQRLVKALCPHCARPVAFSDAAREAALPRAARSIAAWRQAVGCEPCLGRGYRGRLAVGEWALLSPRTGAALSADGDVSAVARTLNMAVSAAPAARNLTEQGVLDASAWRALADLASIGAEEGMDEATVIPSPLSREA